MPDTGQFRVTGRLKGPSGQTENVDMLVDTGATFLVLPRSIAERLRLRVRGQVELEVAGGGEATWPIADVWITIDDRESPTPCLIAPDGEPLLGAVALESLRLAVDPVRRRLIPTKAYVLLTA